MCFFIGGTIPIFSVSNLDSRVGRHCCQVMSHQGRAAKTFFKTPGDRIITSFNLDCQLEVPPSPRRRLLRLRPSRTIVARYRYHPAIAAACNPAITRKPVISGNNVLSQLHVAPARDHVGHFIASIPILLRPTRRVIVARSVLLPETGMPSGCSPCSHQTTKPQRSELR